MSLHEQLICFNCRGKIPISDAVFAAPCDHADCPSAAFCGLCLMDWRDNCEVRMKRMRVIVIDMEGVIDGLLEED